MILESYIDQCAQDCALCAVGLTRLVRKKFCQASETYAFHMDSGFERMCLARSPEQWAQNRYEIGNLTKDKLLKEKDAQLERQTQTIRKLLSDRQAAKNYQAACIEQDHTIKALREIIEGLHQRLREARQGPGFVQVREDLRTMTLKDLGAMPPPRPCCCYGPSLGSSAYGAELSDGTVVMLRPDGLCQDSQSYKTVLDDMIKQLKESKDLAVRLRCDFHRILTVIAERVKLTGAIIDRYKQPFKA